MIAHRFLPTWFLLMNDALSATRARVDHELSAVLRRAMKFRITGLDRDSCGFSKAR
jgi:hypothetical protein